MLLDLVPVLQVKQLARFPRCDGHGDRTGRAGPSVLQGGPLPDVESVGRERLSGRQRRTQANGAAASAAGVVGQTETDAPGIGSRGAGDQRRTRQKVVSDFVTVSKGSSGSIKPRAALRQVLFSQAPADRNQTPEERGQLDLLKQDLEALSDSRQSEVEVERGKPGTTLEKKLDRHRSLSFNDVEAAETSTGSSVGVCAHGTHLHQQADCHQRLGHCSSCEPAPAWISPGGHPRAPLLQPSLGPQCAPALLAGGDLPMLQEVRTTGRAFDPMMLEAGCLQFHERFSAYQQYCWEEESNLEFARRQMESNPHFLTYIQWVETHPYCERMRLGDMQVKPHQRITKYPLLLKAVLKDTEDPEVQHALRSMLSTVKSFLESINDYLRLKDEELALSISAQRVEGYEFVKEICPFDLTCPIRGVGPGVVRKLLLEENLKIRGRKDSKLEVVALLFSDVLLMTKAQKKGEKLKVVRPPLALDRTYCMALKDGCSFVLVEVGELWCAMNVYIFAASTSESCSTWVSTIHQAKLRIQTDPTSSLEGLLERARGRRRDQDRDHVRGQRQVKVSPSFPLLFHHYLRRRPPSDGDKDTEWEEEVQLLRHRALSVSKGWREQLVDGDEDDKGNRLDRHRFSLVQF
ncbi:unnamed protein product [Lampetra planeri]